jgi:FAD/FMN-containing dehydrogenase
MAARAGQYQKTHNGAKMDREANVSNTRRSLLKRIAIGGGAVAAGAAAVPGAEAAPKVVSNSPRSPAEFRKAFKGEIHWKGEQGYEDARRAAVYRENKPNRFPEVIVLPLSDKDVVTAVRYAKANGMKIGRRSGGHSWTSPHLRNGSMLIDMSQMQEVEIDAANLTLWTNPGVIGSRINAELEQHGLIIPTAHHTTVGIGGFVLCGGFGWNSRLWGNGSAHIRAIDVVTADGELIRADETQNTDYLWAARGAGAGFFGVVTRIQLTCHPRPKVMKVSAYLYHDDVLEDLFTWARGICDKVPRTMELVITSTAHDEQGNRAPVRLTVAALALTDSEQEADDALALLETCPVLEKSYKRFVRVPTTLDKRYASGYDADPVGHRYACDNIYTNAPAEQLVPKLRKLFTELPTPRSHVFWLNWGPTRPFPDNMALSVQGEIYLGAYSIWDDPKDDPKMEMWPVERMKELDHLSIGGQMNDENIARHPQRYLSDEAFNKLEALREKHDPNGLFLSYLRSA